MDANSNNSMLIMLNNNKNANSCMPLPESRHQGLLAEQEPMEYNLARWAVPVVVVADESVKLHTTDLLL